MSKPHRFIVLAAFSWFGCIIAAGVIAGCASKQSATEEPPVESAAEVPSAEPAVRPQLSADECIAAGGTVVGDIGDGAIHRTDYRCASGVPPSGSIVSASGEPIGVEGAVCCPQ